jgi:hypothetical protein
MPRTSLVVEPDFQHVSAAVCKTALRTDVQAGNEQTIGVLENFSRRGRSPAGNTLVA